MYPRDDDCAADEENRRRVRIYLADSMKASPVARPAARRHRIEIAAASWVALRRRRQLPPVSSRFRGQGGAAAVGRTSAV